MSPATLELLARGLLMGVAGAPRPVGDVVDAQYGVRSARATPGPCQAALGGDRQPESLPDRHLAQRIDKVSEPALIRVRQILERSPYRTSRQPDVAASA